MKNLLEKIVENVNYDEMRDWHLPNISNFSDKKTLFEYQNRAIRNVTKVLNLYFKAQNPKKYLFNLYLHEGLNKKSFLVKEFETKNDKEKEKVNRKFLLFQNYFKVTDDLTERYILGENFINRASFWMATGSGKSLIIIKSIELLDYLQNKGLIPKKEIMFLTSRDDLILQFKNMVEEFNQRRERPIELISLREYEEDKQRLDFDDRIKVYYYRSDLLRDEKKESILDFKSYENSGNWYIFLDEAHRGKKDDSLMQDYVTILSRNGFLFSFSATFTDEIDYVTTCYNFNLEKFILSGYGKNIYLSPSYFHFTKDRDDFSNLEKQKQVLKSLIVFTLVKKSKNRGFYHDPLLITLVNSVNTQYSDLLLFFEKLEEMAKGDIDKDIFKQAKFEVIDDFTKHKEYVFGDEKLEFNLSCLKNIELKDILKEVFNAKSFGKIEILEGEKGKEIVLKLQTSEKPFALIKIGDANNFKKEKIGENYELIDSFDNKKYFENINENKDINILLGSRSFYEGWDSNRPNVINMINIGKKDAKKFVLQGIGRGIRIEPKEGVRKRLPKDDKNKNILLETLFVFATDKNAVKAIIETVENEKSKEIREISLFENTNRPFDLLLPKYKNLDSRGKVARFNISRDSLNKFKSYINSFDKSTLLIKRGISKDDINFLFEKTNSESLFQIKSENIYNNMDELLQKIITHIQIKQKIVSGVKKISDEIIHFKHIKVINFSDEEIKSFKEKIDRVKNFKAIDKKEIENRFRSGEISFEEALELGNAKNEDSFKKLKIKNIAKHYYLPLIYSENEKVDYIKHIIKVKSEVKFIKNLERYIQENQINCDWMFSKVDESLDRFYIPYFYAKNNEYRNFFPDFIFWIKNNKDDYKIVFVDPKGTSNSDYQNKVDGFEKLFLENDKPKIFKYKKFKIIFDLKLIAEDINSVSEKYRKYWLGNEDFSFLRLDF